MIYLESPAVGVAPFLGLFLVSLFVEHVGPWEGGRRCRVFGSQG